MEVELCVGVTTSEFSSKLPSNIDAICKSKLPLIERQTTQRDCHIVNNAQVMQMSGRYLLAVSELRIQLKNANTARLPFPYFDAGRYSFLITWATHGSLRDKTIVFYSGWNCCSISVQRIIVYYNWSGKVFNTTWGGIKFPAKFVYFRGQRYIDWDKKHGLLFYRFYFIYVGSSSLQ